MIKYSEDVDLTMILWCSWRRQNDKIWDRDMKPINVAIHMVCDTLFQWKTARNVNYVQVQQQQINIMQWKPPETNYVKCNVDAALFAKQQSFRIGTCIRNHRGQFIKAATTWHDGNPPPQEAETISLHDAILWLRQLGISNVHFELDCKLW